jgi:hypothetical protein
VTGYGLNDRGSISGKGKRDKGKGTVVPVLLLTEYRAMKAYWGSGGIAPLIL